MSFTLHNASCCTVHCPSAFTLRHLNFCPLLLMLQEYFLHPHRFLNNYYTTNSTNGNCGKRCSSELYELWFTSDNVPCASNVLQKCKHTSSARYLLCSTSPQWSVNSVLCHQLNKVTVFGEQGLKCSHSATNSHS